MADARTLTDAERKLIVDGLEERLKDKWTASQMPPELIATLHQPHSSATPAMLRKELMELAAKDFAVRNARLGGACICTLAGIDGGVADVSSKPTRNNGESDGSPTQKFVRRDPAS